MRKQEQIREMLRRVDDLIWYDRHSLRVADEAEWAEVPADIRDRAMNQARRIEEEYGPEAIAASYGNDFEWGQLQGFREALEWALGAPGDDWGDGPNPSVILRIPPPTT